MPSSASDHSRRSIVSVFFLSCFTIALQLSLIRILSVTRWHHFTFFIISTALLGYGLSGVFLIFLPGRWKENYRAFVFWFSLATVVLGLPALLTALSLPIDTQALFQTRHQIALFIAYNLLVLVPFFLGATSIGMSLIYHADRSNAVYGTTMLGTAVGGVAAILSMFVLREEVLLQFMSIAALIASSVWIGFRQRIRLVFLAIGSALILFTALEPPQFFVEPYKGLAQMRRWAEQGDARLLLSRNSPRGRMDVYESPLLHFTLFAGITAQEAPPKQLALLRDGYATGTVFAIKSPAEAAILDHTPASVSYRLRSRANVLLVGETGGTNVWLVRRFTASHVTVVQSDPEIVRLLKTELATISGRVFHGKDVSVTVAEPRLFLESTQGVFDVIQIVSAEEMGAESRGATGLQEDYLLTVEGLAAALKRLNTGGILSISRGIQTPPRDSLKLILTLRAALERNGAADPEKQIILLQNYLADTILVFQRPPNAQELKLLTDTAKTLVLDIRWPNKKAPLFDYTDFPSTEQAVAALFSPNANEFIRNWIFEIRPATDDRPFFRDFFRLRALSWLQEVYSDQWYQNLELGFAILLLSAGQIVLLSFALLILPVIFHFRRMKVFDSPDRFRLGAATIYFCAIGLGFMGFEIIAISRMTLYLGDPLYAATSAITCLLLGAGMGSVYSGKYKDHASRVIPIAAVAVVFVAIFLLFTTFSSPAGIASLPFLARLMITNLCLLPLAFFLGFFFPLGLTMASKSSESLPPWGWAVNGFTSVAAPPLLTIVAMSAGQRAVIFISIVAYALAGLTVYLAHRRNLLFRVL